MRRLVVKGALLLLVTVSLSLIGLSGSVAVTPAVMVSDSSDRSGPVGLAGTEQSGSIHVFVEPVDTIIRVGFWIDDPQRSGPAYKDERNAPWDLAGTAKDRSALPFDTSALLDGPHRVTALVTHGNGSQQTVDADFTVANSMPGLSTTPGSLDLASDVDGPVITRPVQVTSDAPATVSLASNRTWITASPGGGGTPLDTVVSVDPSGLAEGSHTGAVAVSAPGFTGATLTVTLQVGTAPASEIEVSTTNTRSSPTALAGRTVRGDVYIFVDGQFGLDRVAFWLDDPDQSGTPYRTENSAPFDLAGGTVSTASPLRTTDIADGPHTVTARLAYADGTHRTVSAAFTVANHGPALLFSPTSAFATVPEGRPEVSLAASLSATSGAPEVLLDADVPWLRVEDCCPVTTPAAIRVVASSTGLNDGRHAGTVTATAPGYSSATFAVQLVVAGDPPTQLHLAWVGDPTTTMNVVWRTAEPVDSRVELRVAGTAAWNIATGAPRPFTGSGVLHEVSLRNLLPDTAYEYRVPGDGSSTSPVHTFRTAPATPRSFDVVYLADTGIIGRADGLATGTADAIAHVADLDPLVVLPGGDYAYFDTDKRFATQDDAMDAWFTQVEPFAATTPMMPTYGNHEALLKETYEPWAARFPTPSGLNDRRNYSFDVGPVHFVSIFAVYGQSALTSSQLSWLKADLAAAVSAGRTWLVPYMHVSTFADGANHPSNFALRKQLGPVFERYGVDLVLMSHDQSYERTYPLRDVPQTNTPTSMRDDCVSKQDGVTWVKVSPAGKLSNKNGGFSPWLTNPPPHWTVVRSNTEHHVGRLHVAASGELRFDALGFTGDGSAPFLVDSVRFAAGTC